MSVTCFQFESNHSSGFGMRNAGCRLKESPSLSRSQFAALPLDVRRVSDLPATAPVLSDGASPLGGRSPMTDAALVLESHRLSTHRAAEPLKSITNHNLDLLSLPSQQSAICNLHSAIEGSVRFWDSPVPEANTRPI
jgi:hypothetical protein